MKLEKKPLKWTSIIRLQAKLYTLQVKYLTYTNQLPKNLPNYLLLQVVAVAEATAKVAEAVADVARKKKKKAVVVAEAVAAVTN